MSYNGSGVFSLVAGNPVVTGSVISSTWSNNTLSDIANNGLSYALTKDGQQTPTANIPMGNFRLTGLGAATARTDAIQYAQVQDGSATYLTSVAGTNTITASVTGLAAYATGSEFGFIPANTNTGATTLNINSIGAKSIFSGGAALTGGEIRSGVPIRVQYDGTQFNIIGPVIGTRITASLGADVNLNNTGTYFDGPSIAQGTVGTWFVSGTVTVKDGAGPAEVLAKLWDGTTVIASCGVYMSTLNGVGSIALSGYITNPAGNLRISCKDSVSTSGLIKFNQSGNSKDSTITAIRIA